VQRFGFEGPRESLVSLGLLLSFFNETPKPELHMKTVVNDLTSLSDHASCISTKINFLLDATLGLINNEQNGIIKIVSVVFLPPTLVASVYGMNFDVMPELKWVLGYPFAVFLMISSAALPMFSLSPKAGFNSVVENGTRQMEIRGVPHAGTDWILQICEAFAGWAAGLS
jgi:CorA-like Mg2+ transporter protein